MHVDKKTIAIGVLTLIIIVLAVILVKDRVTVPEEDPYLRQLQQQNKELENQLTRLKKNYIDIGLADSLQTKSTDSLIAISTRNLGTLRKETQTYRDALEEMRTREWKRLSEAQKNKEIEEALNFLQKNEK